jgi:sulfopyruvate decarboxylase subunit alpha
VAQVVQNPSGARIIAALKAARVEFVASVPDLTTSDGLLWPIARDPQFRLVRVCKEDEGISVCAGLSYSDRRAVLLMQQTGLMDSLNAVRAMGVDYSLPICMLVGLLGKEPHLHPSQSRQYGVRVIMPVLGAMGISHHLVQEPADVDLVGPAIEAAYRVSQPVCILLGRSPA